MLSQWGGRHFSTVGLGQDTCASARQCAPRKKCPGQTPRHWRAGKEAETARSGLAGPARGHWVPPGAGSQLSLDVCQSASGTLSHCWPQNQLLKIKKTATFSMASWWTGRHREWVPPILHIVAKCTGEENEVHGLEFKVTPRISAGLGLNPRSSVCLPGLGILPYANCH